MVGQGQNELKGEDKVMAIQKNGEEKDTSGLRCPNVDASATIYLGLVKTPTKSLLEGFCV